MTTAILVAAGRGTRMGLDVDKLFLEVAGAPVVAHAWRCLDRSPEIDHVVLVIRPDLESSFRKLAEAHVHPSKPWSLTAGGPERQHSVSNGLDAVPTETTLVAIQDGARPCTSPLTLRLCLDAARRIGASVAAQRAVDTIKESDDASTITRHLDRSRLWTVQTPQCFRVDVIRRALAAVRVKGLLITDDTAACDLIGQRVELVECQDPNPKVTSRADLPLIDLLLRSIQC
ncbi:MAG: 2-C-methyl-D-erythritol 4-phosphate cytidylyltransferase [Pedosphaera sp.]|nr:2-C-methyl-D-erythritol 4-phosphate cytidylyltransferase [Pedosphaera sp.]